MVVGILCPWHSGLEEGNIQVKGRVSLLPSPHRSLLLPNPAVHTVSLCNALRLTGLLSHNLAKGNFHHLLVFFENQGEGGSLRVVALPTWEMPGVHTSSSSCIAHQLPHSMVREQGQEKGMPAVAGKQDDPKIQQFMLATVTSSNCTWPWSTSHHIGRC